MHRTEVERRSESKPWSRTQVGVGVGAGGEGDQSCQPPSLAPLSKVLWNIYVGLFESLDGVEVAFAMVCRLRVVVYFGPLQFDYTADLDSTVGSMNGSIRREVWLLEGAES